MDTMAQQRPRAKVRRSIDLEQELSDALFDIAGRTKEAVNTVIIRLLNEGVERHKEK